MLFNNIISSVQSGVVQLGSKLKQPDGYNLVIEGHSFMTITGRPSINIVDRFKEGDFFQYETSASSVGGIINRASITDSKLKRGKSNILVVWIGTNDLTDTIGDGVSLAELLLSYVEARIIAGWDVYCYTMTPSVYTNKGSVFEEKRVIFNSTLRAYNHNKYTVLDTDTVSELSDSENTLYYYDLLHLTWLGGEYAASLLFSVLLSKYPDGWLKPEETDVPISLTVTSDGDGSGVAMLVMEVSKDVLLTLDGNAKFYTNSSATEGESSVHTFAPVGKSNIIYIKCESGTSNLTLSRNKVINFGTPTYDGWSSPSNGPILSGDVSQFINSIRIRIAAKNSLFGEITNLSQIKYLSVGSQNIIGGNIDNLNNLETINITGFSTISGSITNTKLTSISVDANTNLSGDISALNGLTFLNIRDTNTVTGDLSNKTSLTYLYLVGYASVYGDIGGIGNAAVVNGITSLVLNSSGTITYTPGALWSNATVQILNSLTKYIQISMLVDMSAGGPVGKDINFNNSNNESMGDTIQGGIWGDFSESANPSILAIAYKTLIRERSNAVSLNGITVPGVSGDGTGFPAGFGDWYRS